MDKDTRAIIESLEFIKERMVTKDELPEIVRPIIQHEFRSALLPIEQRLTSIDHELRDVNCRLDHLEEQFSNIKGVTKEIDELRDRIGEIEKHLGLNKRIAA